MESWESCIDKEEFMNLCQLVSSQQSLALGYCEALLSSKFESFREFEESQAVPDTLCTVTWNTPTLVVVCRDCQRDKTAEICLSCFHSGDHNGHNCALKVSSCGRCACGDICRWKSGCAKHTASFDTRSVNTLEQKTLYIALFIAVLTNLNFTMTYSPERFAELCEWFTRFAKLNGSIRQCVIIAWVQQQGFGALVSSIENYHPDVILCFSKFLQHLMSDHTFLVKYAKEVYHCQCKYAEILVNYRDNTVKREHVLPMIELSSYAYSPVVLETVLSQGFDWNFSVVTFFKIVVNLIESDPTGAVFVQCGLGTLISNICSLLECVLRTKRQAGNVQEVFDSLLVLFAKIEGTTKFKLRVPTERTDYYGISVLMRVLARVVMALEDGAYIFDPQVVFAVLFKFLVETLIPGKFDEDTSHTLFTRSLFDSALYSPVFPCHLCMGLMLSQNSESITACLQRFIGKRLPVNDFCLYISVLPLRWLAVCHLSCLRVMPVESRCVRFLVKQFMSDIIGYGFLQFFSLLQNCFGLIQDKDTFVGEMVYLYGLFLEHEDLATSKKIKFGFFYALSCLLTDSLCLTRDYAEIGRRTLICLLYLEPRSIGALTHALPEKCLEAISLDEELLRFADVVKSPKGNLWKLKEGVDVNPFLPWFDASQAMNVMLTYQQKNRNKLFPMPPILASLRPSSFTATLSSPVLLAVMYVTLSGFLEKEEAMSTECVHIILNFLILRSMTNHIHEKQNISPVKLKNVTALTNYLQNLVFVRVLWTPFDLETSQSGPQSFVDMIAKLGPVGIDCLETMNIGYVRERIAEVHSNEGAKRIREQVAQSFRDLQSQFEKTIGDLPEEDTEEQDLCSVCDQPAGEGQVLCYPAVMYTVSLCSDELEADAFCFRLCEHLVHRSCVQNADGKEFRCPVDRLRRSILLPVMQDVGFSKPGPGVVAMLKNLRTDIAKRVDSLYEIEALARSFIRHIILIETRLRSLESCVIDRKTELVVRNLFLILWHMKNTLDLSLGCITDTPLGSLAHTLLSSNLPKEVFVKSTILIAKNLNGQHLLAFLRQASILHHLVFEGNSSDLGVEILPENLLQRFSLTVPDLPLRQFHLHDLPDEFIDLAFHPWNLPITAMDKYQGLCLLTGKVVSVTRSKKTNDYDELSRHLSKECKGNATFILMISGKQAGTMCLVTGQFNLIRIVPRIYVDNMGDEDPGFTRGKFLRLDKALYEQYALMLLSGEWTDLDTPA